MGNAQEVNFTTSGGLGESETAGIVMNIVPKTGGNTVSGAVFYSGSGENLQADNTEGTGLAAPTPLTKVYDLNGSVGGPIKRDRIWYFVNARTQRGTRVNANMFYNLNAGDPNTWLYSPDLSHPGYSDRTWENISGRVTWQITQKHALGRPPAGNVTNVTVNLIEPGTVRGDRVNQLDFRIAKILRFGSTRTMIGVDLYNSLNANPVLSYNQTFVPGGPWLQPNSILTPRMARISAEFTW